MLREEYKDKASEVRSADKEDEKEYYKKKMSEDIPANRAWRVVKDILKLTKNLTPSTITKDGVHITNPQTIANTFNNFFVNKVENLKKQTNPTPDNHPTQRLKDSLKKRGCTPPPFSLKPISK